MKAKRTARWLSGSLALALALQMGTANAFAAVLPDYAETMTETSVTAADPDEARQAKLAAELGANENPVTPYTNVHDGERKVILWTKGITPPTIGEADSQLQPYRNEIHAQTPDGNDITKIYQGYMAEWTPGMNWYDVNKSGESIDFTSASPLPPLPLCTGGWTRIAAISSVIGKSSKNSSLKTPSC